MAGRYVFRLAKFGIRFRTLSNSTRAVVKSLQEAQSAANWFIRTGSHRIHYAQDWLCSPDAAWLDTQTLDIGYRLGQTTEERERIKEALERENRELRKANETLRLASAYFAQAELVWPAPRAATNPEHLR